MVVQFVILLLLLCDFFIFLFSLPFNSFISQLNHRSAHIDLGLRLTGLQKVVFSRRWENIRIYVPRFVYYVSPIL